MTIRTPPMASGAMTPAALGMTVQPIVRTRKNVPINSTRTGRSMFITRSNQIGSTVTSLRLDYGLAGKWRVTYDQKNKRLTDSLSLVTGHFFSPTSVFRIFFAQLFNHFVCFGGFAG